MALARDVMAGDICEKSFVEMAVSKHVMEYFSRPMRGFSSPAIISIDGFDFCMVLSFLVFPNNVDEINDRKIFMYECGFEFVCVGAD